MSSIAPKPSSGPIEFIGDLLSMPSYYDKQFIHAIVHQVNCKTSSGVGLGLAKSIHTKWPHANIYDQHELFVHDKYGGSIIMIPPEESKTDSYTPYIIDICGQIYPGKASSAMYSIDTVEHRKQYFKKALQSIETWCIQNSVHSITFPGLIASGMAGGIWKEFYDMIVEFTIQLHNKQKESINCHCTVVYICYEPKNKWFMQVV